MEGTLFYLIILEQTPELEKSGSLVCLELRNCRLMPELGYSISLNRLNTRVESVADGK